MMGTTTFPDHMGDYRLELFQAGRFIQGCNLSGSMKPETVSAADQDLAGHQWRHVFQ